METPPHAPELGLADLPPYDDEQHNDDAHLGPYPLALVAIQAALTALQYEERQLLDDPRSGRCLQDLDDALGAFMAYHYPPEPSDPTPVVNQVLFTPQNQAAPLPGSPEPWNHLVAVNNAPGFDAEGVEDVAPAQVAPAPLADASSATASDTASTHNGTSVSEDGSLTDEEQTHGSPVSGPIHAEPPEEMATESGRRRDASSANIATEAPGAASSSGQEAVLSASTGATPFGYHFATAETAGTSNACSQPIPTTPAGTSALAYLSDVCKIPENERDLETVLTYAARFIARGDLRSNEEHTMQVSSSPIDNRPSGIDGRTRIVMNPPLAPTSGRKSEFVGESAHRGKLGGGKGIRNILLSIRRGLHVSTV